MSPTKPENRSSLNLVNTFKAKARFNIQLTFTRFLISVRSKYSLFCARILMHFRLFSAERLVQIFSSPFCGKQIFTLIYNGNLSLTCIKLYVRALILTFLLPQHTGGIWFSHISKSCSLWPWFPTGIRYRTFPWMLKLIIKNLVQNFKEGAFITFENHT